MSRIRQYILNPETLMAELKEEPRYWGWKILAVVVSGILLFLFIFFSNDTMMFGTNLNGTYVKIGFLVDVVLTDSPFIRRNFADRLPMAEIMLQNMLEVRSTNVYPITVNIKIEE